MRKVRVGDTWEDCLGYVAIVETIEHGVVWFSGPSSRRGPCSVREFRRDNKLIGRDGGWVARRKQHNEQLARIAEMEARIVDTMREDKVGGMN